MFNSSTNLSLFPFLKKKRKKRKIKKEKFFV